MYHRFHHDTQYTESAYWPNFRFSQAAAQRSEGFGWMCSLLRPLPINNYQTHIAACFVVVSREFARAAAARKRHRGSATAKLALVFFCVKQNMLCGYLFLGSMKRPPCMHQTNGWHSRIVHCTRFSVATTALLDISNPDTICRSLRDVPHRVRERLRSKIRGIKVTACHQFHRYTPMQTRSQAQSHLRSGQLRLFH